MKSALEDGDTNEIKSSFDENTSSFLLAYKSVWRAIFDFHKQSTARWVPLTHVHIIPLHVAYGLYKIVLLAGIVAQASLVARWVQLPGHCLYGVFLMKLSLAGLDWESTGLFPRVVRCDLKVPSVGQPQEYTVQCTLPNNMLHEKMLLMLWCVYMALFTAQFFCVLRLMSTLTWRFYMIISHRKKKSFYRGHLTMEHLFLIQCVTKVLADYKRGAECLEFWLTGIVDETSDFASAPILTDGNRNRFKADGSSLLIDSSKVIHIV